MAESGDRVLIIDLGSQYAQLIARRIREEHVYCEIHPPDRSIEWIRAWAPGAVILSGGPASVYDEGVPGVDPGLLGAGIPLLGICYGMQLIAENEGGRVLPGQREYGPADLTADGASGLFHGLGGRPLRVWCSHGDHVDAAPPGYRAIAATPTLPVAAFRAEDREIYGVQFHPEVAHTEQGAEIISNFLFRIAGLAPTWTPGAFVEEAVGRIRERAGGEAVICGLSGGVDS